MGHLGPGGPRGPPMMMGGRMGGPAGRGGPPPRGPMPGMMRGQ